MKLSGFVQVSGVWNVGDKWSVTVCGMQRSDRKVKSARRIVMPEDKHEKEDCRANKWSDGAREKIAADGRAAMEGSICSIKSVERNEKAEWEKLVRDNVRLVVVLAKQAHWDSSPHYEDILQEGRMGLILAAKKYREEKSTISFSTYASYWIRQAMSRGNWKSSMIRIPHRKHQLATQLKRAVETFTIENGRSPSTKELADQLGWTPATVLAASKTSLQISTTLSLDRAIGDREITLLDTFAASAPTAEGKNDEVLDAATAVENVVRATLKAEEQEVLDGKFGLGKKEKRSRKELAKRLQVSEVTITNRKRRAFEKLRQKEAELTPYLAVL